MIATKGKTKSQKAQQTGQRLIRVTISLEPDVYAAFDLLGERTRLSRSWLIREAMRQFLEGNRDSTSVGKLSSGRS